MDNGSNSRSVFFWCVFGLFAAALLSFGMIEVGFLLESGPRFPWMFNVALDVLPLTLGLSLAFYGFNRSWKKTAIFSMLILLVMCVAWLSMLYGHCMNGDCI
jgi:ABC-type multidrug transport system permease subunit